MSKMIQRILISDWRKRRIPIKPRSSEEIIESIIEHLYSLEALIHGTKSELNNPEHYWKSWGALTMNVQIVKQEFLNSGIRSFELFFEELHSLIGGCWILHSCLTFSQMDKLETCLISVNAHLIPYLRGEELCDMEVFSATISGCTNELVKLYSEASAI